jgi:hypothetical protein
MLAGPMAPFEKEHTFLLYQSRELRFVGFLLEMKRGFFIESFIEEENF